MGELYNTIDEVLKFRLKDGKKITGKDYKKKILLERIVVDSENDSFDNLDFRNNESDQNLQGAFIDRLDNYLYNKDFSDSDDLFIGLVQYNSYIKNIFDISDKFWTKKIGRVVKHVLKKNADLEKAASLQYLGFISDNKMIKLAIDACEDLIIDLNFYKAERLAETPLLENIGLAEIANFAFSKSIQTKQFDVAANIALKYDIEPITVESHYSKLAGSLATSENLELVAQVDTKYSVGYFKSS